LIFFLKNSSRDALARIAETLDYLVFDHAPRRPLHTPTTGLEDRIAAIAEVNPKTATPSPTPSTHSPPEHASAPSQTKHTY
jgi:hypothetical protein